MALGLGVEVEAEVAGALVKDDLGHGVFAFEVAGGLARILPLLGQILLAGL